MMRTRRIVVLIGIVVAAASYAAMRAAASPSKASVAQTVRISPTGRVHTRPSIDGAVNPELIPDTLAYHHFLREVALEGRPQADPRRRRSFLRHLQLGDPDDPSMLALIGLAREYQSQLEAVHSSTPQGAGLASQADIRAARDRIARASITKIAGSLPPSFAAAVDDYVMRVVRKRIKVML